MKEVIQLEDRYYILATAAHDERTRVLKHGDTFGLFNRSGNIRDLGLGDQGLYHQGTRFLSRLELKLSGLRPLLLSSSVVENNALLAVDLTNPDLPQGGRLSVARGTLHLFRSKLLGDGTCHERIRLHNYGERAVEVELTVEFEADFLDIFEVRGTRRRRRGEMLEPRFDTAGISLAYQGLDGVLRQARLTFDPKPAQLLPDRLGLPIRLEPQEERSFYLTLQCTLGAEAGAPAPYERAYRSAAASLRALEETECRLGTSSPAFDEWLQRSAADLRMMVTQTPHGPYPYAGVPWYSTPFGRDALITSMQALWWNPALAKGVLRFLAANQAERLEPERDAEPGKIVHELRLGEMAALGEIPFGRYFGTADATPLFVWLAGEYHRATGDEALIGELWGSVEAALSWMGTYGDPDRDGFIEYQRRAEKGLANHGWKDSPDSVFHADGRLAEGPIALCEVQAYAYAAWRHGARLAAALRKTKLARDFSAEADRLRTRFERTFWSEELSSYALALDGEKRPCLVKASNAGHCLFAGIASAARAERAARTLTAPEFFSGWGIRTVAEGEARYNPMSYHNGSVWPHDSAIVAAGLARYGMHALALRIFEALFDASLYFELRRVPELFCGLVRRPSEGPTLYPVACSPQAWASVAVFMLLGACLGMELDGVGGQLRFRSPSLPAFLDEVRIEGLRVGKAVVDLVFHRYPEGAGVNVLRREGTLEVAIVK
ncbi:MAG: amylo-alpha-1,6-glucosidase [Myxococcales bacterium]|nr:amylo-alpha-1,6-glucosidase [Myxococcales bacterium]